MDKLDRLRILTGEEDIASSGLNSDWGWQQSEPKASHIYEGSDSENDDEVITSKEATKEDESDLSSRLMAQLRVEDRYYSTEEVFAEYETFELGQPASENTEFCPLAAVKKYPYAFIGVGNRQKVAETFFDKNQLLDKHTWDLFYIYKNSNPYSETIILIPTKQFEAFLSKINQRLYINLSIPQGANGAFEVAFDNDGTPCPRYLGRSTSSEMTNKMKANVPPSAYRLKSERDRGKPTDRSLEAFRRKIELLQEAQKNKKKASNEKKKAERQVEKQAMGHAVKRVQRYLGLRQTRTPFHSTPRGANVELDQTVFTPDKLAPFVFDGDVVFVCVDIEAYERDNNKITEIGISTLDTRDIAKLAPSEGGKEWMSAIRARHFRISDFKHLVNKDFVVGCPDRFEFGESEFTTLKESAGVVAGCFRHPFSKPGEIATDGELPKRNVVLVGHDVLQDVNYMRKIGFEVYNMSNLMEQVDTASMWRYVTRDPNSRSLGAILADIGLIGWNLHNAGNDAAYTLQAMISIAVKAIVDKQQRREVLEMVKLKRVAELAVEAQKTTLEREAEWDSNAESDGGKPVKPVAKTSLESAPAGPRRQISSQSWTQQSSSSNERASQEAWDRKEQRARNLMYRRGWEQDDAAKEGGWANIYSTEPVRGGEWGFEGFKHVTGRPGEQEENEYPHLGGPNSQQPHPSGNDQIISSNTRQQRWGGLQQSFVSGSLNKGSGLVDRGVGNDPQAAKRSTNKNVASGNGKQERRCHVDAW